MPKPLRPADSGGPGPHASPEPPPADSRNCSETCFEARSEAKPLKAEDLDLQAAAACLQAALAALEAFMRTYDPADGLPNPPPLTAEEAGALPGQIRTYHMPPASLAAERELLRLYRANHSLDLQFTILGRLSMIAMLMEQAEDSRRLPSDFIQLLGRHIREAVNVLEQVSGLLAEMRLVQGRTTP